MIRIVKMSFHEDKISDFLENFHQFKHQIRDFEGNQKLELYRDLHQNNVFFTYSYWKSEQDLENYRNSELFKGVWSFTKTLFNEKPQAWSLSSEESL